MCKAKKRLQEAHGYHPYSGQPFPKPGTIITIADTKGQLVMGELITANPIGLRIREDAVDYFIPWPAVLKMTWLQSETERNGLDPVEDAPDSAGPHAEHPR